MNNLQDNLNTIQETVDNIAEVINEIATVNGLDTVIDDCTQFTDYPSILRSVTLGSSSGIATIFAYKISDIAPDSPGTEGLFNFETNELTLPKDWYKTDDLQTTESGTIWMTQAMFAKNADTENNIVGSWSKPIRISTYIPEIIQDIEQQVYLNTNTGVTPSKPISGLEDDALNDESIEIGWTENYSGLNLEKQYCWISSRKRINGVWSAYSTPVIYAYYSKDGKDGEAGITSRTAFAFISTESRDIIPNAPIGGKWDLNTNDLILPYGWDENPTTTDTKKYAWVSTAIFTTLITENPIWSTPSCITGEDGVAGTDGKSTEFIYAVIPESSDIDEFKNYFNKNNFSLEISKTDVVPNFIYNGASKGTSLTVKREDNSEFIVQLTDSPVGIDGLDYKCEIYWTRSNSGKNWNNWVGPMLWSVWGENGMDGDGIEYIFTASNDSTCDTPLPVYEDLLKNNPEEAKNFQKNEYVPEGWYDNDENSSWTGVGADAPYLFCSSRKQYTDEQGNKIWGNFSTPKIWGHWGKDGIGPYTSFAFCVSKKDLSKCTVIGGRYSNSLYELYTYDASGKEVEDVIWSDTISKNPDLDETVWMISKLFNGTEEEYEYAWTGPTKMQDSTYFQVEFNCPSESDNKSFYDGRKLMSLEDFKNLKLAATPPVTYDKVDVLMTDWRSYIYSSGGGTWANEGANAEYMASARLVNGKWEEWTVNKIKGETGDATQFIFKLTAGDTPDNPTPESTSGEYQKDTYKPSGWSVDPLSVSEDEPVCWLSQRQRKNGKWENYSEPVKWSMYAKGNVHLELSEDFVNVPCEEDGTIDSDYSDHIKVKLSLYDNGISVAGNNITYSAIINGGSVDYSINNVLEEVPTSAGVSGFYGDTLYIGRDYLSPYVGVPKLRIECRAEYKGIGYTKAFTINKSTNTYEMEISHNVLHLNSDLTLKDSVIQVKVIKWVEDRFKSVTTGVLDCIITKLDDTKETKSFTVEPDAETSVNLTDYSEIKSVQINYRLANTSDILTSEIIGTVVDGKDGAPSKFKSQVFCRTNADISGFKTYGGSFNDPFPDEPSNNSSKIPDKANKNDSNANYTWWSDGVPKYDSENPKQIWTIYKWFYGDDSQTTDEWSLPVILQDTADTDIWWSDSDVVDPGNPDSPKNNATWYDGDDATGNNTTVNPVWMATRKQSGGQWGNWVITKVKGEKGEKGDQGEKGDTGFGASMRYGPWKPYTDYLSGATGEKFYDVVVLESSGNHRYLCKTSHRSTDVFDSTKWVQADEFEFVATDLLLSKTISTDRLEVDKLKTTGNGAVIEIRNGLLQVFGSNSDENANIRFGIDDTGKSILEFYDGDKLLYDLGPTYGYRVHASAERTSWSINKTLYSINSDGWDLENDKKAVIHDVHSTCSNMQWNNPATLYVYTHVKDGVAQANHGKYYTNNSNPDSNYANGAYLGYYSKLGTIRDITDEQISVMNKFAKDYGVSIDTSSANVCFYTCTLYLIKTGERTEIETIYWSEVI